MIGKSLIRRAGNIGIHVIAGRDAKQRAKPVSALHTTSRAFDARAYLGSAGLVAAALVLGLVLRQFLGVSNAALVFLTSVLASAIVYGLWPSLFSCVASGLAYNFFFLPPLYTFTIAEPDNVVALFFFTVVALIASNLAARVRSQALTARQRARTTEELYQFSQKLAASVTLDDLLWATSFHIASMLKVNVVLLLPDGEALAMRAAYPPEDALGDADLAAAAWCWRTGQPAGRGADTLPDAKRLFLPMRTGRGPFGVAGLDNDQTGPLLSPEQRRLFNALADQATLAIERINLAQDLEQARVASEAERLRSALLTSISHDLRTPLASILGSATSLKNYGRKLSPAAQTELILTIQEEAERLNRFIANLLDMTKLEAGAIRPKTEPVDITDIAGSALSRAAAVLDQRRVVLDLDANLPPVKLDPVLFEQVLFNLLDNAGKYSQGEIRVVARETNGKVQVQVVDEGAGIPAADLDRIFNKFYRVSAADMRRPGTGLGLAICRGFVEAMGGDIEAANRPDRRGATFTVTLPALGDPRSEL